MRQPPPPHSCLGERIRQWNRKGCESHRANAPGRLTAGLKPSSLRRAKALLVHGCGTTGESPGQPHPGTGATALDPSAPGSGASSVELAARDVTPASQLRITASGFLSGESLALTFEDACGQVYAHATLQADCAGWLRDRAVAIPGGLGTGVYQLSIVGATSL